MIPKKKAPPDAPSAQLTFDDTPAPEMSDLEARFWEWAATSSGARALPLFERFALQLAARARRFGFRLIAERVRWEVVMEWTSEDAEGYKINDHYTPYIAREMIRRHPEIAPLIELRKVRPLDPWKRRELALEVPDW